MATKTMQVHMEWTKKKAINMILLWDKYNKSYLEKLDDYDLFEIGLELEIWEGNNPFKKEEQITLKK